MLTTNPSDMKSTAMGIVPTTPTLYKKSRILSTNVSTLSTARVSYQKSLKMTIEETLRENQRVGGVAPR